MEAEQLKNCCIFPLKMYKHKLKSYQHAQAIPSKNDVQNVTTKRNLTKEDASQQSLRDFKKKRIFGSGFVKVENKR